MKWSVKADIKKCRDALDQYGLPAHVAHRHDKKQFRKPETTDRFDSPLWNAVADEYQKTIEEQQVLPLRAYSSIFGYEHGLSSEEFRHLNDVYRWYCSSIARLSKLSSDKTKQEKIKDLYDNLRAWASDKCDKWIVASWILTHGQASKNNRASFVFEVFRERLIDLLVDAYQSEVMTRHRSEEHDMRPVNGLYGPLFRSGNPLHFEPIERAEISSEREISTIAILQLQGISADDLAKAIQKKQAEVKEIKSKPLPALGTCSHGVYLEGRYVADIADSSVRNYLLNPTLEGEIITYQKSIKIIRAISVN
jgi:hypothetical protein